MVGHVECGGHDPISRWGTKGAPDLHRGLIAPTALTVDEAPGKPQTAHRLNHRRAVFDRNGGQVEVIRYGRQGGGGGDRERPIDGESGPGHPQDARAGAARILGGHVEADAQVVVVGDAVGLGLREREGAGGVSQLRCDGCRRMRLGGDDGRPLQQFGRESDRSISGVVPGVAPAVLDDVIVTGLWVRQVGYADLQVIARAAAG